MVSSSGVSGKKVVYLLFALAVTLAVIVFLVGLGQKHKRLDSSGRPIPADDWREKSKVFP